MVGRSHWRIVRMELQGSPSHLGVPPEIKVIAPARESKVMGIQTKMVFCHLQCIEIRVLCRKTSVGSNIGQENHLRRTMIEQIIQNPVVGWWDLKTIRQKSETYFTCASQNIIIMVTFLLCPNTPTRTRWLSPPAKWANGHKGILLLPWKNEIFVIKHMGKLIWAPLLQFLIVDLQSE